MTFISHFLSVLQCLEQASDAESSLMTRVAVATVASLPEVAGAVICQARGSGMRVPIGSSDSAALLAEQLEFTVGAGPGLDAFRLGHPVSAGTGLARRWPVLHEVLCSATSFQAVLAVPLPGDEPMRPVGVMLLFSTSMSAADHTTEARRLDIARLSLLVGNVLALSDRDRWAATGTSSPAGSPVHRRSVVDAAVEVVMASHHLDATDALDLLRGLAFATGTVIDDAARDLMAGRVALPALT